MTIKEAYYYLFYKLYKLFEAFQQTKQFSDFKAGLIIVVLETFLFLSVQIYYVDFINRYYEVETNSIQTIATGVLIFLVNYFAFINNDKWKEYVAEFDRWSAEKNSKGPVGRDL